jgi:hypothetical protein
MPETCVTTNNLTRTVNIKKKLTVLRTALYIFQLNNVTRIE